MTLRVAVIANFAVPWATGNDLKDTIERLGGTVEAVQEQQARHWRAVIGRIVLGDGPDAIIWNRTPTLSAVVPLDTRLELLETAAKAGIPTIAIHLDRWWGLRREREVFQDPYFRCQYVFSADGHDPKRWKAANINHFWLPPAIAARNCVKGTLPLSQNAEIAFIGTWWGYHDEWGHRTDLVDWLKRYYGKQVAILPLRREPQIRGDKLNDLLSTFKVIVGDSCLVPDENGPWTRYCSDRVFEIPGRGGFLLHPYVEGVCTDGDDALMVPGRHLACWKLGDWEHMRRQINHYLEHDGERRQIRDQGFEHVKAHHTYDVRMRTVVDTVGVEF